jgi:hypothetical membrane protein
MAQPTTTRTGAPAGSQITSWLLLAGIVAPFFFVASYLVAGAARAGYSPIHQAISDLGVGANGGPLDAAVVGAGILLMAFAVGFARSQRGALSASWRWICGVLLALHGLGLVIAGIFSEAPATLAIHWLVGADLAFFGPVAALLAIGLLWRGHPTFRPWATFTLIMDAVILLVVAFTFWVFTPGTALAADHLGGMMERVLFLVIQVWYVAIAWRLLTGSRVDRVIESAPAETDSMPAPSRSA